jgi:hypothetical protein
MTFDAESYVSKSPKSPVAKDNDGDGLDYNNDLDNNDIIVGNNSILKK